jgi:colicin import membrane protein
VPTLSDLQVDFVSLVDRAAVRDPVKQSEPARFLLWKRQTTPTEGDSMTPEQEAALKKAQDDAKAATDALAKAEADKATQAARIAELEKTAEPVDKGDEKVDLSKADPATRAYIEKMEADRAADRERAEKAERTANEATEIAKAERDARITREFVTKAEGYRALVVKADEFGPVLKEASEKLSKAAFDEIERVLKAADEALSSTDLFKEQGRAREAQKADSAYAEAVTRAAELRKSDAKLSQADAIAAVFKADPDLQARHLADVRR